ncbi:MAG: hypothetical protein IBJ16_07290 [Chitinophagaceae bacterium]|nr:hypothetical protein [Chitinophagaceae bacterium]
MSDSKAPYPIPNTPYEEINNPASEVSYIQNYNLLPILCEWVDPGDWRVELRNQGVLYKGGERTERGVTESIYGKYYGGVSGLRIRITDTWEKVKDSDHLNVPGAEPITHNIAITQSVSTQESVEIGLQFGLKSEIFSAEFEAKFGFSVTVSETVTTTDTYKFVSNPSLYVRTMFWQKNRVIDIVDGNNQIVTWADKEVWAVIKPDYNSGKEYQSIIKPPKQGIKIPGMFVQQINFFDASLKPVTPPPGFA